MWLKIKVLLTMIFFLILAAIILYALAQLMKASDIADYQIFVNSGWVDHPELAR